MASLILILVIEKITSIVSLTSPSKKGCSTDEDLHFVSLGMKISFSFVYLCSYYVLIIPNRSNKINIILKEASYNGTILFSESRRQYNYQFSTSLIGSNISIRTELVDKDRARHKDRRARSLSTYAIYSNLLAG